jgi:hypothetical protein
MANPLDPSEAGETVVCYGENGEGLMISPETIYWNALQLDFGCLPLAY